MSNGLKKEQGTNRSWAITGTEIYAFLNLIVATASICIFMGILLLYITESINHTDRIDAFMWSMSLGINLLALTTFVFSVLLYLGIYQKRAGFLLLYIIFGVVIDMILVTTVVVTRYVTIDANLTECFRQAFGDIYEEVTYSVIGICVVHVLVLRMIYRAWSSIRSTCPKDYQKLTNKNVWTTDLSKDVLGTRWIKPLQEVTETREELSAPKTRNWCLSNTLSARTWK